MSWTNDVFILKFTDIFGDGERYEFPPAEMEAIHEMTGEALRRYREGE